MAYAHTKGESIWRMRLLFSVLIAGAISVPDWRIVQLARAESNSLMKRRGSGVGVTSMVEVGSDPVQIERSCKLTSARLPYP